MMIRETERLDGGGARGPESSAAAVVHTTKRMPETLMV